MNIMCIYECIDVIYIIDIYIYMCVCMMYIGIQ